MVVNQIQAKSSTTLGIFESQKTIIFSTPIDEKSLQNENLQTNKEEKKKNPFTIRER